MREERAAAGRGWLLAAASTALHSSLYVRQLYTLSSCIRTTNHMPNQPPASPPADPLDHPPRVVDVYLLLAHHMKLLQGVWVLWVGDISNVLQWQGGMGETGERN